MKKFRILAITLVAVILFAFVGCGEKPKAEVVQMTNPVKSYETLTEINDIVGCHISNPGVMGVTEEKYSVIEADPLIAQYDFSLNGKELSVRASKTKDDISGIYVKDTTLGKILIDEVGEGKSGTIETEYGYYGVFFDGDMQYALSCTDLEDVTYDVFRMFYDEEVVLYK
ncbi:MAG: hypothetical protein MJ129_00600 [Clostridia bacterium]|nr:hypothetical protein [Clostridia bacterium]